jgi:hypothetical protein
VSWTRITDTTKAFIGNDTNLSLVSSGTVTAGGSVTVHASSTQGVYSIGFGFVSTQNNPNPGGSSGSGGDESLPSMVASDATGTVAQTSGVGISGQAALNEITNDTEAYISNGVTVGAGGDLSVLADDTLIAAAATGSFALSLTDTGGGFVGAYAQNTINQTTKAFTQNCTLRPAGPSPSPRRPRTACTGSARAPTDPRATRRRTSRARWI